MSTTAAGITSREKFAMGEVAIALAVGGIKPFVNCRLARLCKIASEASVDCSTKTSGRRRRVGTKRKGAVGECLQRTDWHSDQLVVDQTKLVAMDQTNPSFFVINLRFRRIQVA